MGSDAHCTTYLNAFSIPSGQCHQESSDRSFQWSCYEGAKKVAKATDTVREIVVRSEPLPKFVESRCPRLSQSGGGSQGTSAAETCFFARGCSFVQSKAWRAAEGRRDLLPCWVGSTPFSSAQPKRIMPKWVVRGSQRPATVLGWIDSFFVSSAKANHAEVVCQSG